MANESSDKSMVIIEFIGFSKEEIVGALNELVEREDKKKALVNERSIVSALFTDEAYSRMKDIMEKVLK